MFAAAIEICLHFLSTLHALHPILGAFCSLCCTPPVEFRLHPIQRSTSSSHVAQVKCHSLASFQSSRIVYERVRVRREIDTCHQRVTPHRCHCGVVQARFLVEPWARVNVLELCLRDVIVVIYVARSLCRHELNGFALNVFAFARLPRQRSCCVRANNVVVQIIFL